MRFLSLREHDGRAASLNGRDNIVEDARVPSFVASQLSVDLLDTELGVITG
jgi:hypothetical protein